MKKTVEDGPRLYDVRPGKVTIRNVSDRVQFIVDRALRRAWTDQPSYVLKPGVVYELPPHVFAREMDGESLLKSGVIEIVHADRAALPEVLDLQDTSGRAVARDGMPAKPPMNAVLDGLRGKYLECTDRSVAEAVYMAMEAGISEQDAITEIFAIYNISFERTTPDALRARRQPWLARAAEMVAAHVAREAGLVPARGKIE